jgi:hypothetical protein
MKKRPTQRAADGGYAARFLSIFVALSFFRFDSESPLPPTAANADRWAARAIYEQKSGVFWKIESMKQA